MRKYTYKQLLTMLLPHKALLGISRLADLSDFINIDIKIVSAIRTNISAQQNSLTQGKGKNLVEAASTALLEAVERFCASILPEHYTFNENSSTRNKFINTEKLGYKLNGNSRDIKWVECKSVIKNDVVYLPAMEIYFPYLGKELLDSGITPYTSGLACGGTYIEATVFSILEVIERNIISKFYKDFLKFKLGKLIDYKSISDPYISDLLNNLSESGCEFFLIKINSIMPTYYVALFDTSGLGPKFMVSGSSCNISDIKALENSIFEALQSLYVVLQGAREDLWRHQSRYDKQDYSTENVFFKLKNYFLNNYDSIPFPQDSHKFESIENIYDHLIDKLLGFGCEDIYISDLSRVELPLYVTKVIIPPLFDTFVNPNRKV